MTTRGTTFSRLRHEQSGFTLMELLVAAGLLGIIITLVGSIMVSLITTERNVSNVSSGATNAQLAATTIDQRIQQASSFQVTAIGADQMVVARVAGRGATLEWQCYAWYYSALGNGSIRYTVAGDGVTIPPPDAAALASWSSLAQGVRPPTGSDIFSADGARLTIAFDTATGDSPPVAIRLTSVRMTGVTEEASCF